MKNSKLYFAVIAITSLFATSCTKDQVRIEGFGTITTRTLNIDSFNRLAVSGVDDVIIRYGNELHVEATGHPNIIDRIKTDVHNETWYCQLENGNYGTYELTYYVTIPSLERVSTSGTGDVVVTESVIQPFIDISLEGTGSFRGYQMTVENCQVDITGTGDCEITVNKELDVTIDGTGSVYYRGKPSLQADITGSGKVIETN